MKKILAILVLCVMADALSAQVLSCASYMKASQKPDVMIPFRYLDEGVATPIEWGLDLAWLSEDNIRRGVNFAGKDLIDIVRTSYRPTESVESGSLSDSQIEKIQDRVKIIKTYLKDGISYNINDDHESVDSWYNEEKIGTTGRGKRWAKVIDLHIKKYKELGLTNLVSISPYNEPDFGWDQGFSSDTRMADFLATVNSLKNDYEGEYDGVRMCGGNTLNDDCAYDWWNYLKEKLDEGNTHQLAGNFNNYANFFQAVRAYGHHATADELHNTMEAMVGVEYGMQTGIWWGTCEHCRSQFMKATYHANPGKRLAYGEHRNNWTSASVYRQVDGRVQAFGGTSERQAVTTTYVFAALDRPVWYNGEYGREYPMILNGGTGYQQGQTGAETVIDIQSGTDIMPHINGTYKVMNVNSGRIMGLSFNPSSGWNSVSQKNNGTAKYLQWIVTPQPITAEGDFSYYTFTLNTDKGMMLDILNWNLNSGANVGAYAGGLGTNELWFLEYAGEGAFYIRSKHSALYLDVQGGSTNASANIQMNTFTGEKSQQWRFIPTNVTPDLTAPATPTELSATGQGSSIRLDWTPSSSRDVASYTILRSENGVDYYAIATNVTGNTFTDNETSDDASYSYRIYAVDKSYNYSEYSDVASACVTGEKDCVVYLPFDYTVNDTTQNGNHSVVCGTPSWLASKVGDASFKISTRNYIQLPYSVANHDEITIACWVLWSGGDQWQRIWDFGNGTDQYMFLTPRGDNVMRFAIKNGGEEQRLDHTTTLGTRNWRHVAVTMADGVTTLYLDGEVVATSHSITIKPSDIKPVFNYLGRSQFLTDPSLNGRIDEFRIYNYALNASEIQSLVDYEDAIEYIHTDKTKIGTTYTLSGRRATNRDHGILVRDGKKVVIK
ncbi:MAG: RICIN domain-containing protein [Bacteroidaceae bacterium]|nr:RICIN domain-containing protein [Bacteroidaceae bacterium]